MTTRAGDGGALARRIGDAGRAACPGVVLAEADLERCLRAQKVAPLEAHWAEWYLAMAAALGAANAVELFERRWLTPLSAVVRAVDPSPDFCDEVKQQVRVRLLVGDHPRLRTYGGQGALAGWLRAAAVRIAIAYRDRVVLKNAGPLPVGPSTVTPGSGEEELKLLRAKYGEVAQAAFERALESLDSRSRAVLRMHLTQRTSIDGIAAFYKTHRATAARWLVKMRAELFERTRQELQLALALRPDEVTSLVRLLNPDLEVRLKSTRTGMPPRQRS